MDYGDDERASVLPDEEDEEDEQAAEGDVVTSATTGSDGIQLTQTSNLGEAIGEDTADTQEDNDGGDDKKYTSPRDGSVSHDPVVLASVRVHQTMYPLEQYNKSSGCTFSPSQA